MPRQMTAPTSWPSGGRCSPRSPRRAVRVPCPRRKRDADLPRQAGPGEPARLRLRAARLVPRVRGHRPRLQVPAPHPRPDGQRLVGLDAQGRRRRLRGDGLARTSRPASGSTTWTTTRSRGYTNALRRAAQDAWGIGRYLYQKGIPAWLDPDARPAGRPAAGPDPARRRSPAAEYDDHRPRRPPAADRRSPAPAAAGPRLRQLQDPAGRARASSPGPRRWRRPSRPSSSTAWAARREPGAGADEFTAWDQDQVRDDLPRGDQVHPRPCRPTRASSTTSSARSPPPQHGPGRPPAEPRRARSATLHHQDQALVEKQTGRDADQRPDRQAFANIAAECPNGAGPTGEVPESPQALTDAIWLGNMIAFVDRQIAEAAGPAAEGTTTSLSEAPGCGCGQAAAPSPTRCQAAITGSSAPGPARLEKPRGEPDQHAEIRRRDNSQPCRQATGRSSWAGEKKLPRHSTPAQKQTMPPESQSLPVHRPRHVQPPSPQAQGLFCDFPPLGHPDGHAPGPRPTPTSTELLGRRLRARPFGQALARLSPQRARQGPLRPSTTSPGSRSPSTSSPPSWPPSTPTATAPARPGSIPSNGTVTPDAGRANHGPRSPSRRHRFPSPRPTPPALVSVPFYERHAPGRPDRPTARSWSASSGSARRFGVDVENAAEEAASSGKWCRILNLTAVRLKAASRNNLR